MILLRRLPAFRALRPQDKRTRADVDAFRDRRIRKLVRHAFDNVAHYRRRCDEAGITPSDIGGAADLHLIPVSTRADIQNTPVPDRLARGVDPLKLIERKTTGSSGQCLVVMRTWTEEQTLNLFRWRALRAYGLKRADVIAVPRVRVAKHSQDHQLPRKIADSLGFYRKELIDLTTTDDAARVLHERRSEVIMGWPTILAGLAPKWKEQRTVASQSPRFIITGGEMLSPFAREQISEGFGSRVYDMMGAHELSLVAWECPVTGEYHLSDETLFAEVICDGRRAEPGESGELVVTALHSFAMPFIRYKLGDVVTQGSSECKCGSPFSTMRNIRGRSGDYLKLPAGRKVHPQDIARDSFIAASCITQLQVVQERIDRIELHIVPARPPSAADIAAIHAANAKLLGPDVTFEVVVVPAIEATYETKFRLYRSSL